MIHRRDEQRLGRRQEAAGTGFRATGLVAEADRAGDRRPAGDGERVPEGGRGRGRGRGGRPGVWPKPATTEGVSTDSRGSKPATTAEVSTDSEPPEVP